MTHVLLALALQTEDTKPLPVVTVITKVDEGMAALLKGTAPADAFKPWPVVRTERAAELVANVGKAGGTSLVSLGLEMDLVFLKEGKGVYRIRTVIYGDAKAFLTFRGGASESSSGETFEQFSDHNAPFKATAGAILEALKAKDETRLKTADAEALAKLLPAQAEEIRKDLAQTARGIRTVIEEFAAVQYDEIRIRLDDHMFLVKDKSGAVVGMAKCEWRREKEALHFRIGEFRPLEK